MMNRTMTQKFNHSREKALKNFRKTTANVPWYKKKALEIADRPIADVTAMVSINQFKEWTGLWNTTIL